MTTKRFEIKGFHINIKFGEASFYVLTKVLTIGKTEVVITGLLFCLGETIGLLSKMILGMCDYRNDVGENIEIVQIKQIKIYIIKL